MDKSFSSQWERTDQVARIDQERRIEGTAFLDAVTSIRRKMFSNIFSMQ